MSFITKKKDTITFTSTVLECDNTDIKITTFNNNTLPKPVCGRSYQECGSTHHFQELLALTEKLWLAMMNLPVASNERLQLTLINQPLASTDRQWWVGKYESTSTIASNE